MALFGSALSQSHIDTSGSESVTDVTPIPIEPVLAATSSMQDNTSPKEQPPILETSTHSQRNLNSNMDNPSACPQVQIMSSPHCTLVTPFSSSPIALIVGGISSPSPNTPQTTFYVHADLLIRVSSFFRAAFDNHNSQAGFLEASTLTMRLPEQRPEDLAYLVRWLYCPKGISTAQSLYHELVDIPLQKMEKYKRERAIVQHVEKHGDISQLISSRPSPPAFGPLIRLYILADRLSVHGGLNSAICARVKEVGGAAAAVPSKEDIWRLWDGVPKLAGRAEEGVKGVNADDGLARVTDDEDDLKSVVVEMYANMRGWAVFEDVDESDESFDWHPLFMRSLVIRLLREKRETREALRIKASKCTMCVSKEVSGGQVSGGCG